MEKLRRGHTSIIGSDMLFMSKQPSLPIKKSEKNARIHRSSSSTMTPEKNLSDCK